MKDLDLGFNSFDVLSERKNSEGGEKARNSLERAKDDARRALAHLRSMQKQPLNTERIEAEIKSAILSTIEVEHAINDAIHKIENVIHKVRKSLSEKE